MGGKVAPYTAGGLDFGMPVVIPQKVRQRKSNLSLSSVDSGVAFYPEPSPPLKSPLSDTRSVRSPKRSSTSSTASTATGSKSTKSKSTTLKPKKLKTAEAATASKRKSQYGLPVKKRSRDSAVSIKSPSTKKPSRKVPVSGLKKVRNSQGHVIGGSKDGVKKRKKKSTEGARDINRMSTGSSTGSSTRSSTRSSTTSRPKSLRPKSLRSSTQLARDGGSIKRKSKRLSENDLPAAARGDDGQSLRSSKSAGSRSKRGRRPTEYPANASTGTAGAQNMAQNRINAMMGGLRDRFNWSKGAKRTGGNARPTSTRPTGSHSLRSMLPSRHSNPNHARSQGTSSRWMNPLSSLGNTQRSARPAHRGSRIGSRFTNPFANGPSSKWRNPLSSRNAQPSTAHRGSRVGSRFTNPFANGPSSKWRNPLSSRNAQPSTAHRGSRVGSRFTNPFSNGSSSRWRNPLSSRNAQPSTMPAHRGGNVRPPATGPFTGVPGTVPNRRGEGVRRFLPSWGRPNPANGTLPRGNNATAAKKPRTLGGMFGGLGGFGRGKGNNTAGSRGGMFGSRNQQPDLESGRTPSAKGPGLLGRMFGKGKSGSRGGGGGGGGGGVGSRGDEDGMGGGRRGCCCFGRKDGAAEGRGDEGPYEGSPKVAWYILLAGMITVCVALGITGFVQGGSWVSPIGFQVLFWSTVLLGALTAVWVVIKVKGANANKGLAIGSMILGVFVFVESLYPGIWMAITVVAYLPGMTAALALLPVFCLVFIWLTFAVHKAL